MKGISVLGDLFLRTIFFFLKMFIEWRIQRIIYMLISSQMILAWWDWCIVCEQTLFVFSKLFKTWWSKMPASCRLVWIVPLLIAANPNSLYDQVINGSLQPQQIHPLNSKYSGIKINVCRTHTMCGILLHYICNIVCDKD